MLPRAEPDSGGPEAFWKMAEWLFANREGVTEGRIKTAAAVMGLDEAKFQSAMSAAAATVAAEAKFGQSINIDRIPKIFVNGKWVRQWITDDQKDVVLRRIVEDAAADKK